MVRRTLVALLLSSVWLLAGTSVDSTPNVWTVIAIDPKGDGREPSSADAAQLAYRYDKAADMSTVQSKVKSRPRSKRSRLKLPRPATRTLSLPCWRTSRLR